MDNNILELISFIVVSCVGIIGYISYHIVQLLNIRIKNYRLHNDAKELQHITHLMPWIYAQIAKSTGVIVDRYQVMANMDKFPKTITKEQYLQIIVDIRSHFYGTIPKTLVANIHSYVDPKQIDAYIIAQFGKSNDDGFFKIKTDS